MCHTSRERELLSERKLELICDLQDGSITSKDACIRELATHVSHLDQECKVKEMSIQELHKIIKTMD